MTDLLQPGRTPNTGTEAADAPAKPKKKGKLKKIVIVLVVLALVGFLEKGKFIKPHYRPGQQAPPGQVDTLDQLTVNLSDGHLVQTTIALQLTTVADTKTITADAPQFEDAAISVIGSETYAGLLAPGGRDDMKSQLLARFQKIAGTADGAQAVSAVYFTGLVIQ
ncbi:MAG TPA: flagellar basal body-associated FliL family protein [Acidimicrobiales bacterium]|nr:flagellar basal body-associated FliL family protein [Acidimicrobiales bacterium]